MKTHSKSEHLFQIRGGTSRAKKISSRVLSTVLSILIVASIFTALPLTVGAKGGGSSAAVTSGACGNNLTWSYNSYTLTISGSGDMYNYKSSSGYRPPWYDYKTNITNIVLPSDLTSIGNYAFYYCSNVTSINIPNNVTSIGDYAFSSTGLTEIPILPDNCSVADTAFSGCPIRSGSCGENATYTYNEITNTLTISGTGPMTNYSLKGPWNAFSTSITNVVIESGITTIGDKAFSNCTNLVNITLPNSITSIGNSAFSNCPNLVNITLPNSITSIGNSAFIYCTELANINIPNSVTSIGSHAFFNCTKLSNVTIPDNVTTINEYTFSHCTNLTTVNIGSNVKTIKVSAFSDMSNLHTIQLPESLTTIENFVFSGTPIRSITIPGNVTYIGQGIFSSTENLTVIILNKNMEFASESSLYSANRIICPADSKVYEQLMSYDFVRYRSPNTEIICTISNENDFNLVFDANNISNKTKYSTSASHLKYYTDTSEEDLENLNHIRCFIIEDAEISKSVTFDETKDIVLYLNDYVINSEGYVINGTPHTLEGSSKNALIEVPGDLTIKTTGEGQGGITNDSGELFDVKDGGSLTIENGNYSEDVSEYIANTKVCGKTGDTYTVLNAKTADMTLDNDGRQVIMPNNQDTFARNDLVGVQMRSAEEREYFNEGDGQIHTVNVGEAMRFVSVVRSDILRGAEDYGYVLVKGKSIDNMNARKSDIYVGSDGCTTVSLKGSKNTLANTAYSSANLNEGKYKYLTVAIKDIDDDDTAIGARFYIKRADGTYVYADYTCCTTMGMIKAA